MPDYKIRIIVNGEDRASKTFKDVGSAIDDFGDKVSGIGKGLSVGLTVPLVALGAAALKAGTDLNAGLANIASLGIAESRVLELKANVQDMAIEFGKSTDEMVDGAYQIISTFGDTADTAKFLEISTKAAAAGLATVTDAILLGGAVTKAYGDTSAEAYSHVQDLAFQTVNLGVTTFPELAAAMGKVIPLTAALGVSVEDTFAVMATATGVTGSTSEVVTQLRGIMQSLMDPTEATTELLKAMGIESGKAALEQLGLQGTIETLIKASEATGLPLSDFIGSIEGQTLAMQLAGGSQEQFTKNLIAMQNVTGATDAAFKAQTTGVNKLGFQFQQAKSKLQVFLQTMNDAMGPALLAFADLVTPLGDKIQDLALAFADMDPESQKWIVGLAAGAAALGPVMVGIGMAIPAIGTLGAVLGAFGGVALALLSPLGLLAGAIGAVFYFDVGGIRTNFMNAADAVGGFLLKFANSDDVATFAESVTGSATDIKDAFSDLFSGKTDLTDFSTKIKDALSGIPDAVRTLFEGSDFSVLKTEVMTALGLDKIDFSTIIKDIQTKMTTAMDAITWDNVVLSFESLKTKVADTISAAVDGMDLGDTASKVQGWFALQALAVGTGITTALGSLTTFDPTLLATWAETQATNIGTMVSGAIGGTTISWTGISKWISDQLTKVQPTIDAIFGEGGTTISWTGISKWISDQLTKVQPTIDAIFGEGGTFSTISTAVNTAITTAGAALDGVDAVSVGQKFSDALSSALAIVTNLAGVSLEGKSEQITALSTLATSVIDFLTGFATGIDTTVITTAVSSLGTKFSEEIDKALADDATLNLGASVGKFVGTIVTKIGDLLGTEGFGEALGGATGSVATSLTTAAMNIVTGLATSLGEVDWLTLKTNLDTFVSGFASGVSTSVTAQDWTPVATAMLNAVAKAATGIVDAALPFGLGGNRQTNEMVPPEVSAMLENNLKVTAEVTEVKWGEHIHDYLVTGSIPAATDVAWGEHTNPTPYSTTGIIPSADAIDWGTWTKTYDVTASVSKWITENMPTWLGGGGGDAANQSTGTPSFGGGWTWVGERGPELLQLPRGAQVLSNQQSMGMIGQLAGGTGGLTAGQQAGFNAFVANQAQKESDKAAKELKKSVDKMGKTIDKSIDDMAQKLGSILQSIPGLFGTSSVTADQMKMGALGVPQNFADDYLRRLTDEVVNGVDWANVDIADAAARAGIDPSLPHEAILEMFKAAWGDSSLFANAANLDLINQEAVQAGIDKANAQAAGKANIMALFGIAPDEATAQAVTLGTSLHTGIQQGITQGNAGGTGLGTSLVAGMASDITPESMAPVASAIATGLTTGLDGEDVSFGTALESVINKQLEGEGLFSGTAGMILEKIAGYFTDQEFGIDLIGNFASIWVNQLGVQSAIDHLLDVGGRIAEIVFKGYQAKSEELDWTGAVTAASLAQTTAATTTTDTTTTLPNDIIGKGFMGGVRQAATNAATTIINVYATVNNEMDINRLAYQVAAIQNRRR